jgi:hypothetical protein
MPAGNNGLVHKIDAIGLPRTELEDQQAARVTGPWITVQDEA